jgi:hypothetical protein
VDAGVVIVVQILAAWCLASVMLTPIVCMWCRVMRADDYGDLPYDPESLELLHEPVA